MRFTNATIAIRKLPEHVIAEIQRAAQMEGVSTSKAAAVRWAVIQFHKTLERKTKSAWRH